MRHVEALRIYTVLEMPRTQIDAQGRKCVRARLEGVIEGRPAVVVLESTQPAVIEALREVRIGDAIKLFGKLSRRLDVCTWSGVRRGVYRLAAYAVSMPRRVVA